MRPARLPALPADAPPQVGEPTVSSRRAFGLRLPFYLTLFGLAVMAFTVPGYLAKTGEIEALREGRSAEERAVAGLVGRVSVGKEGLLEEAARYRTRQSAFAEKRRHLRIDREKGELTLAEDGYVLRKAVVTVGAPVGIGDPQDTALAVPLRSGAGMRVVVGTAGTGIFPVPGPIDRLEGNWPDGASIPENLSSAALLEDGTVIYSTRGVPWTVPPARDGTMAMTHKDLSAILNSLEQGTPAYVW